MAFTAGEITNIANAALDYYWSRPEEFYQTLQDKPLLKWAETEPEEISRRQGQHLGRVAWSVRRRIR